MIVLFSTELHSSIDKIFLNDVKIFLDKLIILTIIIIYPDLSWPRMVRF